MNKIKTILVLAVLIVSISSCTTSSDVPVAVSVTSTATITPLTGLDDPTPISETPAGSCNFPAWSQEATIPDISALKWEAAQMPDGSNYLRSGKLTTRILAAEPSPDGNWWVIEIEIPEHDTGGGSALGVLASALYVLDAHGDNHWLASANGRALAFPRYAWLSDGRLAWVDAGLLQVADASGANREKNLTTPEPVRDIRAGAGNLAFVTGESMLWRVNLETGAWNAVSGLPARKQALVDLKFSLSPDQTYATVVFDEKFWKIPLAFDAPAQMIADTYGSGSGPGEGGAWNGPQVLSDTPFWSWYAKPMEAGSNVLIDTENAKTVPVDSLIPAGEYFSDRNNVSPDGRWFATSLFRKPVSSDPPEQSGLYIAPANELAKGVTIPGYSVYVSAWRTDVPAAIVIQTSQKGDENLKIRQLSLVDGSFMELLSVPQETQYDVLALPERTLIRTGNTLHIFSANGKQTAELSLPPGIENFLLGASNSQALIFNIADDNSLGQCFYASQLVLVMIK